MINKILIYTSLFIAFVMTKTMNLKRISSFATFLKRKSIRKATYLEAESVLILVNKNFIFFPFRLACLEKSLTTIIFLSFKRLSADWYIGVGYMPFISHSWIEVDNIPVNETEIDVSQLNVIHAV
jgi:hypothetical protein